MFTVPHTAHRTLILLVSMYMLLGYCQVRSFNTVYYIVQCHSNFNLLCCKTGRRGSSVLAAKTHSQSNHRHFTDIEHATGTKSSWVRAVWRLTSVTAETELTNGDSRNINNYKKKLNPPFLTWIIFYCFIKNVCCFSIKTGYTTVLQTGLTNKARTENK